jgi:drug/metabolite transporter (DMT)-like permease
LALKVFSPHATLPRAGLALLVLLTVFWGFNWPVMKFTLAEIPLWSFRAVCIAGGAAGLFAIAAASRLPLGVPTGQWPRLLLIALFNITGWNLCSAYGVTLLPSGRAAIIAYTMPLWSVLLSVWLLGEPMTRRRIFGVTLGMLGMLVLIGGELGGLRAAPLGAIFMIGAALSWALGTVCMKRYPLAMPTTVMTAWIMLLGGVPIFIGAAAFDTGSFHAYGARANFGIVYNVLVCFVFCYWAWFKIVEMVPVSVSALSTLMIPVVGVFSGLWVLGEIPNSNDVAALVLVAAALATVLIAPPAVAPADSA